jgi:hypothetical protein
MSHLRAAEDALTDADLKRIIMQKCATLSFDHRLSVLRHLSDVVDCRLCEASDGTRVNLDLLSSAFLLDLHDYVDDLSRELPAEYRIE